MSQNVVLEEGGSINVHTRIKDMCKRARNQMGLTNQDISNLISERFGFEEFSVNTVNNFFSERSKATTIYTTGYICAVLNISIDAVFGIETDLASDEDSEFVRQLSELKVELRFKDQEISNLQERIKEKEQRIDQAHIALEHFRQESCNNRRKVQPWIFMVILALLIASLAFIVVYLVAFDLGNSEYGLLSRTAVMGNGDIGLIFRMISAI